MILSCGEALIDMLPRTSTLGEPCFAPYAGGAVMNTAIALGRLGTPSGFFSGLSNDMLGDILNDTLQASHVDTSFAARSGRPTTVAFVKLVNGQASYAFYDENTAGVMLSQDQLPTLPAHVTTLFFGGISLVNDPAASTYAALQVRECGTRVTMIDPNIRLGFIAGKEVAYRARIAAMIARADIVKLSDEDLFWLMGPGDIETLAQTILAQTLPAQTIPAQTIPAQILLAQTLPAQTLLAQTLLAQGPKLVFITEGAAGARAFTPGRTRHMPSPRITVADTVGAGDTFNAGALSALHAAGALTKSRLATLTDAELDAALSLGTRAAAITCSRPGANPPWAHEL